MNFNMMLIKNMLSKGNKNKRTILKNTQGITTLHATCIERNDNKLNH